MPQSYFVLVLDTIPPASPVLVINGGAPITGVVDVTVDLSTTDFAGGANDVLSMKLWGDVDASADPAIQPAEVNSLWQPYREIVAVRLSTVDARKYVKARLKDDVCNETVEFADFIDLDSTTPQVSITTPVDRSKISKVSDPVCGVATFYWQSSLAFSQYQVRVVPSASSPHTAGVLIGTAHGSTNVAGVGSFPTLTPLATSIHGGDLEDASPGDGGKVVKVFVKTAGGVWSV